MLNPNAATELVYNKSYSLTASVGGKKPGAFIFNGPNQVKNAISIDTSGTPESYSEAVIQFIPKSSAKTNAIINYGDEISIKFDFTHMKGYLGAASHPFCPQCYWCGSGLPGTIDNRTINVFTVTSSPTWLRIQDPKSDNNREAIREGFEFSLHDGSNILVYGTGSSTGSPGPAIIGPILTTGDKCLYHPTTYQLCTVGENVRGAPLPRVTGKCAAVTINFVAVQTDGTVSYRCVENSDCKVNEGYFCDEGKCVQTSHNTPSSNNNNGNGNIVIPSSTKWIHWMIIGTAVLLLAIFIQESSK
jgi:hypothetical protein